jgi:anthranilate synthase/aminodeoxychorismate synthase-like glutamine amidotransferase
MPNETGAPRRVLLIDNYDSFVHNLARYLQELGTVTEVIRNDRFSVGQIESWKVDAIVLSPGPCRPDDAGVCVELIRTLGHRLPVLGVCLGHQAIGAAFGGRVVRTSPVQGRTSLIDHDGTGLFFNCERPLRVARYHSLIVEQGSLPDCLNVTARTADGTIMALAHNEWPVYGVQFHPESVLSMQGHRVLANFLTMAGLNTSRHLPAGDLETSDPSELDFYQRTIDPDVFRPL